MTQCHGMWYTKEKQWVDSQEKDAGLLITIPGWNATGNPLHYYLGGYSVKIKIIVRKVFPNGVKSFRVDDVVAATDEQVPDSYVNDGPHCYLIPERSMRTRFGAELRPKALHLSEESIDDVIVGDTYSVEEFDKIVAFINQCGTRLMEIRKKLRESRGDWRGVSEIII